MSRRNVIGDMKTWKHTWLAVPCAWALFGAFPSAALADGIRASAAIQPVEISFGETAQLNIVIEGSVNVPAPRMPEVDGLKMVHVGNSSSFQFINGAMFASVTHVYQVLPRKEGTFKIPEISITVDQATAKTAALTLKVGKGTPSYSVPTAPSSPGSVTSSGMSSPSVAQADPAQAPPPESSEDGMVQLIYPKRDFYVGELIPTDIKIYLGQEQRIIHINLPTLSSTAFTIGKLGNKFEQGMEMVRGVPYSVLTWHTAIAAVKAGEHPLGAQFEYTKMVRVNARPSGGGLLDERFDRFFGSEKEQQTSLSSPEATVKILSLPAEGRPPDFSSAIGRFEIGATLLPNEVTAGDPTTLQLTVTGTGNFDRVTDLKLGENQGFKTYKPSVRFEPSNESGYIGRKIFEQVIVPQSAEIKEVPPVHLSFFDPESRKYVTLSTPAIPINVLPGHGGSAPDPSAHGGGVVTSVPNPATALRGMSAGAAELVPNKLDFGSPLRFLPVTSSPWFYGVQSVPLAALAIAWGLARRRARLENDPTFAREVSAGREVRAQVTAMDGALKAHDPAAFFSAARRALQERLAQGTGCRADTITLSEAEPCGIRDPALLEGVRKIFETADAIAYSGQHYSHEELAGWRQHVLDALKKLEATP